MTDPQSTLTVTVRTLHGKGPARQLRQKGLLPGVMYGKGRESQSITLDPKALRNALDPERRLNTFLKIIVKQDGKPDEQVPCLIADVQRDTLRGEFTHVDFVHVDPDTKLIRRVPVNYLGRPAGVLVGGVLKTNRRHVNVRAKPADMPVELSVDVTALEVGMSVKVRDVELGGVGELLESQDLTLAAVEQPKVEVEEEPEVAEGEVAADGEAPAEGEAGAEGEGGEAKAAAEGGDADAKGKDKGKDKGKGKDKDKGKGKGKK